MINIRQLSKSLNLLQISRNLSTTKNVKIIENTNPKVKPQINELVFGKYFSDHMLYVDYNAESAWSQPTIAPFQDFSLSPGATSLHYGIQCFEGMKAYRSADGDIKLFRPLLNMQRMKRTAAALTLPDFDAHHFLRLIKELIKVDSDWVPDSTQASLYIRPTYISTDPVIGVKPPSNARFYCITCPVGPYYEQKGGDLFQSVNLLADPKYVRACEGGIGAFKAGGNYAPTLVVQRLAAEKGCSQVLWLYGPEERLTEVGTMNLFVFMINKDGEKELITPPLSSGLILPGVTRQSVLDLTREWGEFKVTERELVMAEFLENLKKGNIVEVFGAGTACMICPIQGLLYNNDNYVIPTMDNGAELSKKLFLSLQEIQVGRVQHMWSESIYSN